MTKINFYLESRLAAVKKRAEDNAKYNPEGAYKSALTHQVKYKRKGWIKYDTPNDYDDEGNMRLYSLDGFNATALIDVNRRAFDITGYYADSFQHELVKPYIVKIKAGKKGVFIAPAIAYDQSDIATIYFSRGQFAPNDSQDIEHDRAAMEAARIADSLADSVARDSRECDAENQAIQEQEQLSEDISECRKMARSLIIAIKAQRKAGIDLGGAICDALTEKLNEYRREVIRKRERIAALDDNYWLSVEGQY